MPTNVTYEYTNAEREFHNATTTKEKLAALQEMLRTAPSHKGADNLRGQIRQKIKKLKEQAKAEKRTKGRGKSLGIKKEGAAQIAFIGLPNAGKSTLLTLLSGSKIPVAEYPFTTKKPVVKMVPYEKVKLQGIEIPAIYEGFGESSNGRQLLSLIRNSDLIVIVLEKDEDLKVVKKELERNSIKLAARESYKDFISYKKYLVVKRKEFRDPLIPQKIWLKIGKIRVQTKGGKKDNKPTILKKGSNVEDLAKMVHKEFIKKFKFARVWGPSAKFKGQQVGLDHKLKDGDIVEIFTK